MSYRKRIADVLQEIQQYQNSPYCLTPEPSIQVLLVKTDIRATPQDYALGTYMECTSTEPARYAIIGLQTHVALVLPLVPRALKLDQNMIHVQLIFSFESCVYV